MDGEFAAVAVELVALGVIGNRVDEMESGFLMALDYMIQLAQKDGDDEVLPLPNSAFYIIDLHLSSLNERSFRDHLASPRTNILYALVACCIMIPK